MDVNRLQLQNLGRFQDLTIEFAPTPEIKGKITVLIGSNGAGKTSILKALATNLSWFAARIRSEKGSGNTFPEIVVSNQGSSALATIEVVSDKGQTYSWSLAKTAKGKKATYSSNLSGATQLANTYREELAFDDKGSLPLVAFYPVERVVLDVPLKIRNRHSFLQLDGYDNSLVQGVDFRRFFEWFREREDIENESGVSPLFVERLKQEFSGDTDKVNSIVTMLNAHKDKQLEAVRTAISRFIPEFSNLRVQRKPRLHMSVEKNGEVLNVLQLSQGEKSLMALVGDIARRLAMMNPSLENPLEGDGIVLIDEVDLHLHPQWQRSIVQRLADTFPNCQFVLTTHSPLVISDSKNTLVYSLNDGELTKLSSQYGLDANAVLLGAMDTAIRNVDIDKKMKDLLGLIQDSKLEQAQLALTHLEEELGEGASAENENIEITKARILLRKQEIRDAKNQ